MDVIANFYQDISSAGGTAGEHGLLIRVLAGLFFLAAGLAAVLYGLQMHTVRIYNWNGKRYCYLGRAGLHWEKGCCRVRIKERMADLSYTTLYQVCPSGEFVRRYRYKDMILCAGEEKCMLHVDHGMRQSIYYRRPS